MHDLLSSSSFMLLALKSDLGAHFKAAEGDVAPRPGRSKHEATSCPSELRRLNLRQLRHCEAARKSSSAPWGAPGQCPTCQAAAQSCPTELGLGGTGARPNGSRGLSRTQDLPKQQQKIGAVELLARH